MAIDKIHFWIGLQVSVQIYSQKTRACSKSVVKINALFGVSSRFTAKVPERRQCRYSDAFMWDFSRFDML